MERSNTPDDVVEKAWCHCGTAGLVMMMMGMKEWGEAAANQGGGEELDEDTTEHECCI